MMWKIERERKAIVYHFISWGLSPLRRLKELDR